MENIIISASEDAPAVTLDVENGKYEISGKSMPENVVAFYQPILDWLEEYANNGEGKMVFDFKLIYFNTASSKILLDIMIKLEEMHEDGKDVSIRWYYPEDDEDMEEAGEEYEDMVDLPFECIAT